MLEVIKKIVETEFNIRDISSRIRTQDYVDARTVYFILAQRNTNYGLSRTSRAVNRHHATALHSYKIYEQWLRTPQLYTNQLRGLEKIDKSIQDGLDDLDLTQDTLSIYYEKNVNLKMQVDSLLEKLGNQEKELITLRKELSQYL